MLIIYKRIKITVNLSKEYLSQIPIQRHQINKQKYS